ncbi:MAG: hypothetical protein ACRDSS_03640 [Actinocrinis sp.]
MTWVPWWAWTLAGAAVYVPCWRFMFRLVLADFGEPDGADLMVCVIVASALAVGAPVLILARAGRVAAGRPTAATVARWLGGESRTQKRARLERELAAREQRIRQAERELGIGP